MSNIRTALFASGVSLLLAAGAGSSGAFHTHLVKSEPAANDTLSRAPRALRLWFSERVELAVTTVKLADQSGAPIALAPLARPDTGEAAPVVASLAKSIPPGHYVVSWSTAAKDGHPSKGTIPFVIRAAH